MKIRNAVSIGLLCLACQAGAQTADELVAQGRSNLPSDLSTAFARFNSAVNKSPNHAEANALAAATRILTLPQQSAANKFLTRLGVSASGRDLLDWQADFKRDAEGEPILPSTLNTSEAVTLYRNAVMPALNASITNLARITDTNFLLTLSAAETGVAEVTLDYGDVMLLRSLLNAADFFGHTLNAHNFNVAISRIVSLGQADQLTIQKLLAEYPKLLTTSSKPDLLASKAALTNAIECYFAASEFIRNARQPGADRLFELGDEDLVDEEDFRLSLAKILESIHQPVRVNDDDPEDLRSIYAGNYFAGTKSLRSLLPRFSGNWYVNNSLPDYTLGGTLIDFAACDVEAGVREAIGFPYSGIYVAQEWSWYGSGNGALAVLVRTNGQATVVGYTSGGSGLVESVQIDSDGNWELERAGLEVYGGFYDYGWMWADLGVQGDWFWYEGSKATPAGTFANQSGYYTGTWSGGGDSGKVYGILTASGRLVFAFQQGTQTFGGGSGQFQYDNQLSVYTGIDVQGSINPSTAKITGTFSDYAGSGTWTLTRAAALASDVPAQIVNAPGNQTAPLGSSATFKVTASGSAPLSYQWYQNGAAISKASGATLVVSNVAEDAEFTVEVRNLAGSDSATALLQVVPENIPPVVKVLSPAQGQRVSNDVFTVTGTASDNAGIASIECLVNGSFWETGNGTNWAIEIPLNVGTNVISVHAVDTSGNVSKTNIVRFIYVPSTVVTWVIDGRGTISPNYSNAWLEIGKKYTVTATPAKGWVLSNWVASGYFGRITSNGLKFTFEADRSMVVWANFVTNPFIATKGTYTGLFYETNDATGVLHERSGFFSLQLAEKGSYSGQLRIGNKRNGFTGAFDLGGMSTAKSGPLDLALQLDLAQDGDRLSGAVTASNWTAQVAADRAVFSKSKPALPFAGSYTMIIPGREGDTMLPQGDSYGSVVVNNSGAVALKGMLADGTVFNQSGTLSKNGDWPLYTPLYGGGGSVLSWIAITNHDLAGESLSWIKPAQPKAKYYAKGFTNDQFVVLGSGYQKTNRVIAMTNGMTVFTGGNLGSAFTNDVTLNVPNKVVNGGTNKLVFTIIPASGQFRGTVTLPGTKKSVPFKGVMLQDGTFGSGYFLGTNQSGRIWFGPDDGLLEDK